MTFHKQIKNRSFCQHLWDQLFPIEALIFFRLLPSNCLSWKFTAMITLHFQLFSLCNELSGPNFLSPALLYKRNLLNADTHSDPAVMGLVFSEGVASIRRLAFITFQMHDSFRQRSVWGITNKTVTMIHSSSWHAMQTFKKNMKFSCYSIKITRKFRKHRLNIYVKNISHIGRWSDYLTAEEKKSFQTCFQA